MSFAWGPWGGGGGPPTPAPPRQRRAQRSPQRGDIRPALDFSRRWRVGVRARCHGGLWRVEGLFVLEARAREGAKAPWGSLLILMEGGGAGGGSSPRQDMC